jgi:hypothetical protein
VTDHYAKAAETAESAEAHITAVLVRTRAVDRSVQRPRPPIGGLDACHVDQLGRADWAGLPFRYDEGRKNRRSDLVGYSHSMVPGGFDVMSTVTRLISRTSLVIRVETRSRTSYGRRAQSAVIASSEVTGRSTTGWP